MDDWFKPLAYALILLRKDGYPCLFYGDYFGNPGDEKGNNKLISHRKLIDDFLQARAKFTHGEQHDYFDHPTCVGWLWSGDAEHPACAGGGDEHRRRRLEAGCRPSTRTRRSAT